MKRTIVAVCACLIVFPLMTFAQGEPGRSKMSLGANVEVALPMGNWADVAGTGYGGNLRYQLGADARTVFTATAGYLVWGKKDLGQNSSVQPEAFNLFLGGKYYLAGGLYGSLEGGLYFLSYTYEGPVIGVEGSTTQFMLPIGLGYQTSGFELGVRYMLLAPDYNNFSFTLGYNFTL
jgi:hypothetical protein